MADLMGTSEWVRPKSWKMKWELRSGGEVLATMSAPGLFGTSVRASVGGEAYVIRKGGLRRPGATLTRSGEREPLALLEFDALRKGTVRTADGESYTWERSAEGEWVMSQEGRGALFTVVFDTTVKYPTGKVDVDIADPLVGPLLLLSWFLISTSEC